MGQIGYRTRTPRSFTMAVGRVVVLEMTWMLQRQEVVKKFAWHAAKLGIVVSSAKATRHIGLLEGRQKGVFHNAPLRRSSFGLLRVSL